VKTITFVLLSFGVVCFNAYSFEGHKQEKSVELPKDGEKTDKSRPVVNDEYGSYLVQEGDTLLLISWKLYGTIHRWKELAKINNENLLAGSEHLKNKMQLIYRYPEKRFIFKIEGNPYLVRPGDTLGSISEKIYKTPEYWRVLLKNNQHLIRDPNLIFAGFTIYYPDDPKSYSFTDAGLK